MLVVWLFYPSPLVPSPKEVASAWVELVRNGMFYQLYVSLVTNLQAIAISTVISLLAAYVSVIPAARPFVVFLSKARFFSMTGFVVVFTLMFGVGHGLKVALLVFGMCVFFITSMADVVASIPREEYDHARTLRMSEWRILWEVVILGRADYALESLRQNAAISWMLLTMVEGLSRSEGGIGAMMLNENKHFNMAAVFAVQMTVLAVGVGQDWALGFLKRIACPYASITLERQ
jgi:NitT/TauT family transport system permease protein